MTQKKERLGFPEKCSFGFQGPAFFFNSFKISLKTLLTEYKANISPKVHIGAIEVKGTLNAERAAAAMHASTDSVNSLSISSSPCFEPLGSGYEKTIRDCVFKYTP